MQGQRLPLFAAAKQFEGTPMRLDAGTSSTETVRLAVFFELFSRQDFAVDFQKGNDGIFLFDSHGKVPRTRGRNFTLSRETLLLVAFVVFAWTLRVLRAPLLDTIAFNKKFSTSASICCNDVFSSTNSSCDYRRKHVQVAERRKR
jgi:hypothetical protein